jgi:hypothetical protein
VRWGFFFEGEVDGAKQSIGPHGNNPVAKWKLLHIKSCHPRQDDYW